MVEIGEKIWMGLRKATHCEIRAEGIKMIRPIVVLHMLDYSLFTFTLTPPLPLEAGGGGSNFDPSSFFCTAILEEVGIFVEGSNPTTPPLPHQFLP